MTRSASRRSLFSSASSSRLPVGSSGIVGAHCSVEETSASAAPVMTGSVAAAAGAWTIADVVDSHGDVFEVEVLIDEDPRASTLRWLDSEMDKYEDAAVGADI